MLNNDHAVEVYQSIKYKHPLTYREGKMTEECNHCQSTLRVTLPARGDRDSIYTCTGCGRIYLIDSEIPQRPPTPRPLADAWLN